MFLTRWAIIIASIGCGALQAQEVSHFAFSVGGGFTQTMGNAGRHLDNGWNLGAGIGVNVTNHFGIMVDAGYNRFGINGASLTRAGFPNGNVSVFSATLDPVFHVNASSHVDMYIIGGGGLYHTRREFTQPSTSTFAGFDPFFGFYNVSVPTTEILASYSVNKPGANLGAGVAIGTRWHGKLFAEARYHRIFLGNERHADYIPVSVGFRW
ncbi:MAG: outer membrane beta-barrel protein [Bryobacteraceae bacterium]